MLGPPGAGKGTQAERLSDDFGLPHIATGDILRAQVAEGTDLGTKANGYMEAGELVPDDVIIGMITERIAEGDARDGFVLDGFPRNTQQAGALTAALEELDRRLTAALLIAVPDGARPRRQDPRGDARPAREPDPTRPEHRGARPSGRALYPLPRRHSHLQGVSRLPRVDLRVAERDDRARHPRRLSPRGRRHHLDRRR